LVALASGMQGDDDALPIHANARGLGATQKPGDSVEYRYSAANRMGYLAPATHSRESGLDLKQAPRFACLRGGFSLRSRQGRYGTA